MSVISSTTDGSCGVGIYTRELLESIGDDFGIVLIDEMRPNASAAEFGSYVRAVLAAFRDDPDVVHVQHEYGLFGKFIMLMWAVYPLMTLLSWITKVPVVVTVHELYHTEEITPPFERAKRSYVLLMNTWVAQAANCLVFLSDSAEEGFVTHGSLPESVVMNHGAYSPKHQIRTSEAKSEFDYHEEDLLITLPGYVRESKGHETFIKLAEEFPGCEFLIAGGPADGSDEFFQRVRSQRPTNVQISGWLNEYRFHAAFQASDLVVLPYRTIFQSGIFNWCAAYSLPTIASDIDYFQRMYNKYGTPEIYESFEDLVSITEHCLSDRNRREKLESNIERYQDETSLDGVVKRHHRMYHRLESQRS